MILIVLLMILAVLLFGSSAVIGAIGWLLGTVAAVIAFLMLKDATDLSVGMTFFLVFGIILCGAAILFGALVWVDKVNRAAIRRANGVVDPAPSPLKGPSDEK